MSLRREDYEWLVKLSRWIYAQDLGPRGDENAKKLFKMCEDVIGQQSPRLEHEPVEY